MPAFTDLTTALRAGRNLSAAEVGEAAALLSAAEVADEAKAGFLSALAAKGETAEEVAEFARAFRARAVDPGVEAWAPEAIDIVGTGGDQTGGFNISTMVVFVLASAGVKVMKHGNRGVTSRCGSADLMAALGVDLEATPARAQEALAALGFAFFFAPAYHPSFRQIGPARKALAARGQRTIFNILGPLVNPGRPARILLGVFPENWVPRLAAALESLGTESGLAVHGVIESMRGIDELTTATVNRVRGIGRLRAVAGEWSAADCGLRRAEFSELLGGDLPANLAIVEALVSGLAPAGLEDTVALNAAVALWICGRAAGPFSEVEEARGLLRGGAVRRKLDATREFYRRA